MRISDWSSDVCSSDLQSKPLGIGHALFRACYGDGRRMDIGLHAALVDDAHRRDFIVHRPAAARVDAVRIAPSISFEIAAIVARCRNRKPMQPDQNRSEENTSELQSLMRISYAVFCLKK